MKKLLLVVCALAVSSAVFAAETCSCKDGDADCYVSCVQTKVATAREATAAKIQSAKTATANGKQAKAALKAQKAAIKEAANQEVAAKKADVKAAAKAQKEALENAIEYKISQAIVFLTQNGYKVTKE